MFRTLCYLGVPLTQTLVMNLNIAIFCFVTLVYIVQSIENINKDETLEYLDVCLIDILSSKSHFGADLAIINNDMVTNELIRRIHEMNNIKLYIKDYTVPIDIELNTYVIYVEDLKEFKDIIDALDKDWYRRPEALFIIILSNISENDFMIVFKILWEHHIIRILIISDDINETASVYTYYPYGEGKCGRDYDNITKLCDCKSAKDLDVIQMLQDKDKPVLTNCTLQIGTHHCPPLVLTEPEPTNQFSLGIERMLLELLLKKKGIFWNYTFYNESDEYGNISDNFTVSGKLRYVYKNKLDLVFGSFALNKRRAVFFDYICTHLAYVDNFVAIIPSTGLVERWKIIYKMFNPLVWLLLLLMLLICSFLLSDVCVIRKFQTRNRYSSEVFYLFGNLTQNVSLNLRRDLFKNIVIVPWLWFIFLVQCYYQTRLTSFSTYQSYKPQINTFTDLSHYNITPSFSIIIYQYLTNSDVIDKVTKRFAKIDISESDEQSLDKVPEVHTQYFTITHLTRFYWWLTKHPQDKNRVHLMKEPVHKILLSIFFKRGFPLLQEYNAMMLRLVEYGFAEGVKGLNNVPDDIEVMSERDNIGSLDLRALNSNDLSLPFYMLLAGSMCAFLAFILELSHKDKNTVN